jgi:sugar lactone lactonase YvrE
MPTLEFTPLPVPPSLGGESPFWHPRERALYWVDIPGHKLNRFEVATATHKEWTFPSEACSIAPRPDGGVLMARRDGLFHFDTASGESHRVLPPPYDPRQLRFNDGKADPQGRFWVGTIHDQRLPRGSLYCLGPHSLDRIVDEVANSNGLAWSPDGATMYWTDTKLSTVFAFDFEPQSGDLSRRPSRTASRWTPTVAGRTAAPSTARAATGRPASRASASRASRPTARSCSRCRCPCAARRCRASAATICARCT